MSELSRNQGAEIPEANGEIQRNPNRVVFLGSRGSDTGRWAARYEGTSIRGGSDHEVEWTDKVTDIPNAFFGLTAEHPDAPRTIPGAVVAFPNMRQYDERGPAMTVPAEDFMTQVAGLCLQHGVPLQRFHTTEGLTLEAFDQAMAGLEAAMRGELPIMPKQPSQPPEETGSLH